jgi:hypothetical protein
VGIIGAYIGLATSLAVVKAVSDKSKKIKKSNFKLKKSAKKKFTL